MGLADLLRKRNEIAVLPGREFALWTTISINAPRILRGAANSLVISLVFSLIGCAPVSENESPENQVYRLPWPAGSGKYELQDIVLQTFTEPSKLRGEVAQIIVDPRVSGGQLIGEEPIGRWTEIKSNGVLKRVPSDFVTLQAAVLYAHHEKLNLIDRSLGLFPFLKGPSKIGLLSRLSDGFSTQLILNNAIFDGRLDVLFVVPFTGPELPISMNAGIIAHEHFHRLFQATVLRRLQLMPLQSMTDHSTDLFCQGGAAGHSSSLVMFDDASPDKVEGEGQEEETVGLPLENQLVPLKIWNQTVLRGVNEGLADFWGWSYANDDFFVGRSLGAQEDSARRLDRKPTTLPSQVAFRNMLITIGSSGRPVLKSESGRVAAAYRLGTEYARVLRMLVDTIELSGVDREKARSRVRSAVGRSLETLAIDVSTLWMKNELNPELLLRPVIAGLLASSGGEGPETLSSGGIAAVCRELKALKASKDLLGDSCPAAAETRAP